MVKLHDLGFKGPLFTWHRDGIFERLDRMLGKKAWVYNFLTCSTTHLPKIKSDHRPLLLSLFSEVTLSRGRPFRFITHLPKIKSDHRPLLLSLFLEVTLSRGRPFRFLVGWAKHPDFRNFVGDNWKFSRSMSDILAKLTDNLKEWNNSVYGHITTSQEKLMIKKELKNVIMKNFSENKKGDWIYDPESIVAEANNFFQKLKIGTYDEIKDALFDMVPFKALESDDFHAIFFQKQLCGMEFHFRSLDLQREFVRGARFLLTFSYYVWSGPLIMHSGASVNLNSDCCLNEMVSEDGSWNLELLWVWFSNDVIQRIMVKSAYKVLNEGAWNPKDEKWKCAWKLSGPQRVRFFIWTILKQCFLSNVKRAKRGLVVDPSCPICDYELEDTLHIVRDYTAANDVWNKVIIVQIELGNAASRRVIRNKNGAWVSRYNRYLGKCSIFYVELWGILEGLKLCQR
ncbi:hypothetical protein Golax_003930 [Gossypium laxum]|uniref:Reverse transcriptase zinc-binding domain-containing protein n=1 Tax=Gossypium laxum TaxID=34288 RepID=A0A7J9AGY8_9ROSI|nr:hypothetical protein [Gossypium laxum]